MAIYIFQYLSSQDEMTSERRERGVMDEKMSFRRFFFPKREKKTKVSIADDDNVRTFLDDIGNKQ